MSDLSQAQNQGLYPDNTEVGRNIIMEEIMRELRTALSTGKIYNVRQSVEAYEKQLLEFGICDERAYDSKRQWIMKYLIRNIPEILFTKNKGKTNESKRITSNSADMQSLVLKLAEERAKQAEPKTRIDTLQKCNSDTAQCFIRI